ncbi:hypothetical protein MMPV_004010 [Pyropia vietnamensis]
MRILIIRHADPEYHGDTLTPAGHAEAAALGARLARGLEGTPDFLYTSPLGRARDTAAAIAVAAASPPPGVTPRTLTPAVEGWTRELSHWPRLGEGLATSGDSSNGDGDGNGAVAGEGGGDGGARPGEGGLALWDVPPELIRDAESGSEVSARLMRAARGVDATAADGGGGGGGGGSGGSGGSGGGWDSLVASSDAFLARHGYERVGGRYKVTARNSAVLAVVCHGGFGLTWLAHLLRLDPPVVWTSFWMAPSSVTTVLFDERSPGWATPRCIGLGDISHLEVAGLRIPNSRYEKPNVFGGHARPSGIKANFR